MQPNYRQFEPGQLVRSVFGEQLVVSSQLGCQVFVEGMTTWYHPAKLFPVGETKQTSDKTLGK